MNTPKTHLTRPFERRCTQDCDQGGRCTCAPEAGEELTIGDWARMGAIAVALVAIAAAVAVVVFVAPASVVHVIGGVL